MYVAIDGDRIRHLLVPADSETRVPVDRRSKGVILIGQELEVGAGRTRYADLVCVDADLSEAFVRLAEDVADRVAVANSDGPAVVQDVLEEWRALLSRASRLSVAQSVGLFGELEILKQALNAAGPTAFAAWHGPHGSRHDFISAAASIEVKTSTRREGRLVEIHGVEQLEPPEGGKLILAWVALREDVAGARLYDQVEGAINAGAPRRALLEVLNTMGYEHDRGSASDTSWIVRECLFFVVDANFPHITADSFVDGVPPGIQEVDYVVDLAAAGPNLDGAEAHSLLAGLA